MRQIITFDCYGTLVDFALTEATLDAISDRLPMDWLDTAVFIDNFRVMRFQAVLESYRDFKRASTCRTSGKGAKFGTAAMTASLSLELYGMP